MRKIFLSVSSAAIASTLLLFGCSQSNLNPKDPVTLTLWHVYGEQTDSPMNLLIEDFNQTIGEEQGIFIKVTNISNVSQIGQKLLEAQEGNAGAQFMPDLFFCHSNNAEELGIENLINWNDYFTEKELDDFIPSYLEDGIVEDTLSVFPVSKSTHVLCVSGTQFQRFSADTGAAYEDLSTWKGFFNTAEKYYEWSGGKPFCALDYLIRAVELNALEKGADSFYTEDGWYDFNNPILKESFMEFANSLAQGHIIVSDLYSNTQLMTNEVIAGIGSSASILYYSDVITYPDNTTEPMDLQILPVPKAEGHDPLYTQSGVGLCAYKTTSQKAEAASVFAHWLTESERNLDFCVKTGYVPVTETAFNHIRDYEFPSDTYKKLYSTLGEINRSSDAVKEPNFSNYYTKVYALYDSLRDAQKEIPLNPKNDTYSNYLADSFWKTFTEIGKGGDVS